MKALILGGDHSAGLTGLRNLDTVADPSVTRRGGRPWMVLGGMHGDERTIQLYAAQADTPGGTWRIRTQADDPELAVRLSEPAPPDAWDATGYHCPCYVRGTDDDGAVVERIYYASSSSWTSLYGPYLIGFLQHDGEEWKRHPEPVFAASEPWQRGTVLEPHVDYRNGRWRMRYTTGLADGTRSATATVDSPDGIGGWRQVAGPDGNRFDTFVIEDGARSDTIFARQPPDANLQADDGLWYVPGSPDGSAGTARHFLKTTDGTPWHNAGAWKPTALADGDDLVVFFTAAQRNPSVPFPALGIGSLRLTRR